jgi:hypothetical protein
MTDKLAADENKIGDKLPETFASHFGFHREHIRFCQSPLPNKSQGIEGPHG